MKVFFTIPDEIAKAAVALLGVSAKTEEDEAQLAKAAETADNSDGIELPLAEILNGEEDRNTILLSLATAAVASCLTE